MTTVNVTVKWNGTEYLIEGIDVCDTVLDLKKAISKKTNVLPERQKLMGLKFKGISELFQF